MTYLSDRLRDLVQPKQRFKCEHVKAGFLIAARVNAQRSSAVVELCNNCYDRYQFLALPLILTADGKVEVQ